MTSPGAGEHGIAIRDDADVDTTVLAEYERTRRELLRRGLAVGSTALAASSVPLLLHVRNAFGQAMGDVQVVKAAIGLEQVAVFAYGAALGSGKLDAKTTQVARLFKSHEEAHRDALTSALQSLGGGSPPVAPASARASSLLRPLLKVRSQKDIALYAIELESVFVAAYHDAHRKLKDAHLLKTGAQIMANEGQHLVVLRTAVKRPPVPDAFEIGRARL